MSGAEPDGPPDGFLFILPFLDLSSRFNIERLNKSLREAVKDSLVWADLKMEGPACKRLTDKILLELVERADGHLKSLSLVDALGITNVALSRISERNPRLQRISVPGCVGLEVEDFVSLVEAHSRRAWAKGLRGISQVRLRGLSNISPEHLLRLGNALGVSGLPQKEEEASSCCRYYGNRQSDSEATDKRPVDVELCPDCENVRLIYDCTSNKHRVKENGCSDDNSSENQDDDEDLYEDLYEDGYKKGKSCRSCRFCIPRCEECGNCLRALSCKHILCAGMVCTECWFAMPKCNRCNRPACSRHEEDCFPDGYYEICGKCHEELELITSEPLDFPSPLFEILASDSDEETSDAEPDGPWGEIHWVLPSLDLLSRRNGRRNATSISFNNY